MACDEGRIHAYFDGELAPPETAAVRAHLRGCRQCRQLEKEIRWLHRALGDSPRRRYWMPLLAAAAVLALFFVSWKPKIPPSDQTTYQVSLEGETHQVKVEGAELVELSLGETEADHAVDLRKARME